MRGHLEVLEVFFNFYYYYLLLFLIFIMKGKHVILKMQL